MAERAYLKSPFPPAFGRCSALTAPPTLGLMPSLLKARIFLKALPHYNTLLCKPIAHCYRSPITALPPHNRPKGRLHKVQSLYITDTFNMPQPITRTAPRERRRRSVKKCDQRRGPALLIRKAYIIGKNEKPSTYHQLKIYNTYPLTASFQYDRPTGCQLKSICKSKQPIRKQTLSYTAPDGLYLTEDMVKETERFGASNGRKRNFIAEGYGA